MLRSPFFKSGFTLVEVVIVVASLSILVLSLVPQSNLGNVYVEAAAQRLEQDFRYARDLAVTKNINCGIEFQTNGNYTVYENTTATPALNPLTQQPFQYNLNNNFKNVAIINLVGTLRIEFNRNGTPILGQGSILQVSDNQKTISLTVTPNTGFIQRL